MPHQPTEQEKIQSEVMLDLTRHRGFRLLMSYIDKQGQELLNNLLDATDNPNIATEERLPIIYQIACNLKANRELHAAIDTVIRGGKTPEELQAMNPQSQDDTD